MAGVVVGRQGYSLQIIFCFGFTVLTKLDSVAVAAVVVVVVVE